MTMFYEEKIINGILHFKTSPSSEWRVNQTSAAKVVNALFALTEDERVAVFGHFCRDCGKDDPRCQCWNDE